jgi:hypothetical protein
LDNKTNAEKRERNTVLAEETPRGETKIESRDIPPGVQASRFTSWQDDSAGLVRMCF